MQINQKYEQTIKFRDLFFHILYHWRSLLVILLAGMLIGGGYHFISFSLKAEKKEDPQVAEQTGVTGDTISGMELSLSEINGIRSANTYLELLEGYRKYYENSLLFRINPFEEWVAVKTYRIDQPEENIVTRTKTWLPAYYASFWNVTDKEELEKVFGSGDLQYVSEVITMFDGNKAITGANDSMEGMGSVFSVKVIGTDQESAEKRMTYVSGLIENQCHDQIASLYPHEIEIMGESILTEVDTALLSQKESFGKNITNDQKALDDILKSLDSVELQNKGTEVQLVTKKTAQGKKISIKYTLKYALALGGAGLVFLVVVYAVLYIFGGVLHSSEDLKAGYMLPAYGEFEHSRARKPGKGLDGMIEKWERKGRKGNDREVYDHICALLMTNYANKKVLLTGTVPEEKISLLLQNMRQRLDENALRLEAQAGFSDNTGAIPATKEADAVLIVEEKHHSRLSDIRKMAETLQLNQANVSGCIVL